MSVCGDVILIKWFLCPAGVFFCTNHFVAYFASMIGSRSRELRERECRVGKKSSEWEGSGHGKVQWSI